MSDDKRVKMEKLLENTRAQLLEESMKNYEDKFGHVDDSTKEATKILLPIIGRMMSTAIANDIIGVQPMFSPYSREEWPYQADMITKYNQLRDIEQWCRDTLKEGTWINTVQFFAFNDQESYAWFTLRWE